MGVGRGWIARARGELGVGEFRFARTTALLHLRAELGPFVQFGGTHVGHVFGEPPSLFLFRVGGDEGLAGYGPGEFGGSTAVLGRGRVVLPIPPRGRTPLFVHRRFLLPPLRPGLALGFEAGWSDVREAAAARVDVLGAVPTDELRGSIVLGVSIFDDGVELGWVRPFDQERTGAWGVGFVARH